MISYFEATDSLTLIHIQYANLVSTISFAVASVVD